MRTKCPSEMCQLLLGALCFGSAMTKAEPFTPSTDSFVVERLPKSFRLLNNSRRHIAEPRTPNADELAALTRRYLEIAQRTSDPAFVRYAERSLQRVSARQNPEILFLDAVIQQHNHHFEAALARLNEADLSAPFSAERELLKASIYLTEGNYEAVKQIFARHVRLASSLRGLTLLATTASLTGALEKSERALETALNERTSSVEQAFAWCALAEMAERRGDNAGAEQRFKRSLKLEPSDSYTLTTYCDLLLSMGRGSEVLQQIDPQSPSEALLTRRLLAAKSKGQEVQALVQQLRGSGHARELALLQSNLLLDREDALATALENWTRQKEPIDTLLVLRCAISAQRSKAAEPVVQWLSQARTEDVRMMKCLSQLKKQ